MSGLKILDPSKLHLMKKELTQIRKVAKGLPDPGTTSSWKSPLTSSRSVPEPPPPLESSNLGILCNNQLDSQFPSSRGFVNGKDKEKEKVFLYNWKAHKTSSEKSGFSKNSEGEDATSWIHRSLNDSDDDDDDDVSDARNVGDSYLGKTRSASLGFGCRDTNLLSPSFAKIRKKKSYHHQPKEAILGRRRSSAKTRQFQSRHLHAASGLSVVRDASLELSDETKDFSNSGNPRKVTKVSSPLLLKLKHKNNWSHSSSKFLRATSKREDSSHTCNSTPPLSTSSYNMYAVRNPSTVGSWEDGDDDDDLDDDNLDFTGRQGCGIPFYWTKKNLKHRGGCRNCCSPSFSDTLRKTGTSMLCGSQSVYRRHRHSSGRYDKQKLALRSAKGVLPLLKYGGNSRGGSSIGFGYSDDDLSTDFGELDLEAQSRLDGRRWSTSCRSQDEGGEEEEGSTSGSIQSLSHKYKPMFFDELIGQGLVVQSLMNAVKKGSIAHVYLFQGSRGTGKTSTARILSAALNCDLATQDMKPCGYCKECSDYMLEKSRDLLELDAGKKNGAKKVTYLLKKLLTLAPQSSPRFKVFVIDECHLLPSKTWLSLLKFLENPLQKVVFICVTTDLDNVPRTIQSRCQSYLFNKVRDGDIVVRLRKIASDENLDVESQALDLIALNADGSLRDAETMLDQLSLMGKRITVDVVNELVGVVSDDNLLELLELALSSDTAETVKKARELLDVGADPILMMSQLASLIMDIIAGAYKALDEKYSEAFLDGRNLTEADMERLKHALKLLSEAEKQLRVSTDRSTWFIATLLQLGSMPSPGTTHTGSSRRQSTRGTEDPPSSISREVTAYKQRSGLQCNNSASPTSMRKNGNLVHEVKLSSSSSEVLESDTDSHDDTTASTMILTCKNSEKLNDIWIKCVDKCHSKTLQQLLYAHGKLLSISEVEGILVAYIAFGEREIKARAERFLSSVTNSIEMVLRRNVEVRIILLSETELLNSKQTRQIAVTTSSDTESGNDIPMKRIEAIIQEQRLETEWLQKTPGSQGRLKPERNQVLPQEDTNGVKVLKIREMGEFQENQTGKRMEHCPVSPSLLHNSKFTNNNDNLGYESESGRGVCSLLFCWNTQKSPRRSKIKGNAVRSRRSRERRFSLFSGCARPRK
ncbi:PREDICTED: protein STICHEL-like 1 [Camelina sativa]|uniref:Protein STICHEL-like 1 n=1 Tax=Camelina sativa TaxID=90675 RepID=A0ABM0Y622_CAMSA|nr:PREDICTED: protein STICHEL-like 1 [Camelina sativa]